MGKEIQNTVTAVYSHINHVYPHPNVLRHAVEMTAPGCAGDSGPEHSITPPDPTLALTFGGASGKLRKSLVLCHSEGMNYPEIAQALYSPLITVRGMHHAKKAPRKE